MHAGIRTLALLRLSSLLVRPACPVCGACSSCKPICEWCSMRLYANSMPHWSGDGHAAVEGSPGAGVIIESPFSHSGVAKEIVHKLKFGGRRRLGRVAARLMADSRCGLPGPGDLVVPIPLSGPRLRSRGYNQSGLIAARLARLRGADYSEPLRRKDRPPQVGLPADERRRNLRGSFSVLQNRIPPGSSLWIVDDVVTTGATISEAAAVLMDAGAAQVKAITLTYRRLSPGCIIEE
jgi:ComF family protein